MNRELERIRAEYGRRRADPRYARLYASSSPASLFESIQRERTLLGLLRQEGVVSLTSLDVLDVGCGRGAMLRRFLDFGATPGRLHGVELMADRVTDAVKAGPSLNFVQGDAGNLPYAEASFDLVSQFTVFSSILDNDLRSRVAGEMLRVLRPNGLIVWYDFWLNPTNRATRGIRPPEIRSLFPDCRYRLRRVTLAPPIARLVVPWSRRTAALLESIPFLKSHYLASIRPNAL